MIEVERVSRTHLKCFYSLFYYSDPLQHLMYSFIDQELQPIIMGTTTVITYFSILKEYIRSFNSLVINLFV